MRYDFKRAVRGEDTERSTNGLHGGELWAGHFAAPAVQRSVASCKGTQSGLDIEAPGAENMLPMFLRRAQVLSAL